MNLVLNVFRVVTSNVITLISNIVLGLILPIVLSVKSYGEYRLYLFYLGYVGLLHFGFIDARYLRYGGTDPAIINKQLLKREHRVFVQYQLGIALFLLLAALLSNKTYLIIFALAIVPLNVGSFHKLFYQATGQFKKYSYISITYTAFNLFFITLLLLFKEQNALLYMTVTLCTYFIVFIIMEIDFFKYTGEITDEGHVNVLNYSRVGIYILIGNICVLLTSSISSWFVQLFFTINDFGYYSFSVAMTNLVLVLVSAIGLTFYHFIAKSENQETLIVLKQIILIIGAMAGCIYFILNFVVMSILPQYSIALDIISISFMALPYLMVINILITNLYKARKQEKRYFRIVLSVLLVGIILNGFSFLLFQSMVILAAATTLTFIIWYIHATYIEFRFLKASYKEVVYLSVQITVFIISVRFFTWYYGFVIYFLIMFSLSLVLFPKNIGLVLSKLIPRYKNQTLREKRVQ